MTARTLDAVAFVEHHGVVLALARGPVPNLAEGAAGSAIKGSWWSHAKGTRVATVGYPW